jgi:effector-binding domain-containing protein
LSDKLIPPHGEKTGERIMRTPREEKLNKLCSLVEDDVVDSHGSYVYGVYNDLWDRKVKAYRVVDLPYGDRDRIIEEIEVKMLPEAVINHCLSQAIFKKGIRK